MEALEGGRGPEAGGRGRGLLLALGVVLLIRVPFLNQPIQGDDHTYISEAAHALVEPLHPGRVQYVFQGDVVDLRGHPHPPLNAWALAGLIAVFGDVREIPFHAAYLVFSLIAAWAMWRLACRFSPRPAWATLLFVAVPAFVVNGNSLEADLPFLAFWMAGVGALATRRRLANWPTALFLALAALAAYQAVLLTPILGVYVWLYHRRDWRRWALILVPPATIAAWQGFERLTTGAVPAGVLAGYLSTYGLQALGRKAASGAMLFIHSWFIVFPALVPGAFLLAWRKRREPDTLFLLAWIGIFFAGALAFFFAGSARYLLPMAAPVAILASRLRPKWLALGFGAQMALGLGLAAANYQHWDGYRNFAELVRGPAAGHRVWVNGEWGLRYYLEKDGALPLTKTQPLRPGDIVVTSELGRSVDVMGPGIPVLRASIRPRIPLRLIGLDSHSGYSTVSRGFWPFGVSTGIVDNLSAAMIQERHPTLEYLTLKSPEARDQVVSGVFSDGWMSKSAILALKNPNSPEHLRVQFYLPPQAAARHVSLLLDGREVAAQSYPGPGLYKLDSDLAYRSISPFAVVQVDVDRTFTPPGDKRQLGVVLMGVGFAR